MTIEVHIGPTCTATKELKPEWGIKLTCIEPGGFRTDWSGRSMEFGEVESGAYDHIDPKKNAQGRHHTQPGDPAKAAKVFYDLAVVDDPPLRCAVGTDAYKAMTTKVETYKENVQKFEKWTNSTDVDGYKAPS